MNPNEAVSILPPSVAQAVFLAANADPSGDRAFRFEAVGDLIVDCGHEPLRTEIHPPTNILFHASVVHADMPQKRYGVFGWRRPESPDATAEFDLWPGPRTPYGNTLTVSDGAPRPTGTDALECAPYPPESPNRIRCKVPAGGPGNHGACADSPRMLPACAKTAAGGLYDVKWAP
jgi:hypothetical protein